MMDFTDRVYKTVIDLQRVVINLGDTSFGGAECANSLFDLHKLILAITCEIKQLKDINFNDNKEINILKMHCVVSWQ